MGGGKIKATELAFPMEGLLVVSTYVIGLVGALAGRFLFGLSWVSATLVFVPCYGLVCGIANNESRRIVSSRLLLLLFPLVPALSSVVSACIVPAAGRLSAQTGAAAVELAAAVAGVAVFLAVMLMTQLVSSLFAAWSLPSRVHAVAVRGVAITACTALLVLTLLGLRFLGPRGLGIDPDRRAQLYTYALADEVMTMMPPTASAESVLRIREWEKSAC